jgi:hypothetical protein
VNTSTTQSIPATPDTQPEIDPSLEADYLDLLDYDRACDLGGAP